MAANTQGVPSASGHIQTYALNPKRDNFLSYMYVLIGLCVFIIGCALFAPAWRNPPMMILGTVGPVVAIYFLVQRKQSLLRFNVTVKVYSEGFSYAENGQESLVRWDDVKHIWQDAIQHYHGSVLTETSNRLTLQVADDSKMTIDLSSRRRAYKEYVERLGAIIQNECTRRILVRVVDAFNAGQTVSFGDAIHVNKQGIVAKDKTIAWGQIDKIDVINGELFVRQQGKWIKSGVTVGVYMIPDLYVLLKLVALVHNSTYNGREVGALARP